MPKSKTNKSDNTHVIKRGNGWAVKREGTKRASNVYNTKEKAIRQAAEDVKHGGIMIVHKSDGTIEEWTSHIK